MAVAEIPSSGQPAHGRDPAVLRGPVRPDLLRDEVLSEIFAASVAARPSHPAIVFGERFVF